MSSVPTSNSPDKFDLRPSFRKPSNDGAHRKYRHHSPVDEPDSSSSGGSPRHEKGTVRESRKHLFDDRARKYHGKESEREPGRSHSSRGSDSHRYPDNCRSSRDYPHNDERGGYHRLIDDEDRNSIRHSGREIKAGRSDRAKQDSSFERSKENLNTDKNVDRYNSMDKSENSVYGSRGKDRDANVLDNSYNEKESYRSSSGSRQLNLRRDNKRDELDRPRERDDRDDKRIRHRSPNDYRKEVAHIPEDTRRHTKDSFIGRESTNYRLKESQRKEIDEHDYHAHRRRYNDKDDKKHENKYSPDSDENRKRESDSFSLKGRELKSESYVHKKSSASKDLSSSKKSKIEQGVPLNASEGKPSSSKQVKETTDKFTVDHPGPTANLTESAQDLNAAKVAAMQAAELVNKNLVGTGFMSTDQKKKLLWGSKKNTSEESVTRWDLQLFEDRERQEKFNKLMGVKGDAIPPERKPDEKDVEKQKELQIDLEKQYTAGLRRRDGRTVGLGL